ncbi:MAG: type II secretion system F family protein [Planctomycetia bacterium]|nr:type II secretion system F family protein [Planctomycetia bacterium]
MPEFNYEAMGSTGARSTGTLVASSEREVMAMLDARGLFPLRIAPKKTTVTGSGGGKRVGSRHLATFYAQLADLLHSGVPLLRSFDILERQASNPGLSEVIREVKAKVADGTSLADSMAQYPNVFDELAVSMVKAGQEGGFLEDVLRRIANFTEHQEDLKAKVTGALAYPVFLAVIGIAVLNILVIFFVPQFKPIFDKLSESGELPFLTVMLIGLSYVLQRYAIFVLAALVLAWWGFWRWASTPSGRLTFDAWKLRVPGAGGIFLNLAISRFARILGTMLHNGIPILNALRIAKDSTGNKVLAEAIDKAAENVKGGDRLAEPLAACKYIPRDVIEIISVGEESNNLEKVLVDVAEGLEKRTNRQLDLFVRLLEPVMLLVMAVFTLLIVAGLLLPVFQMSSTIK